MDERYGLMLPCDGKLLDYSIDSVCEAFPVATINLLEVGVFQGVTARGLMGRLRSKGRAFDYTGIDITIQPEAQCEGMKMLCGDSFDVAGRIPDRSQHWILIDACHDFPHVVADFLAYKEKLKRHGLLLFHDITKNFDAARGTPVPEFYQGHGSRDNLLRYVAVRPALIALGLLEGDRWADQFELVQEDPGTETSGGMLILRRV